ncbi:MAG: sugar phosphate isomerase/epimerase [Treponema sp.]|nr:sugar phosphate isomerase/epimerase [Treponema sp.]
MSFNYSVQLYSVRTVLQQDPLGTLHKLRAMGYTGVEGFGSFSFAAQDVQYALSDAGLKLVGYHTPWGALQADKIDSTMDYFKSVGNRYVIVPALPAELTSTIDDWKKIAGEFNVISKRLQDQGMILGYHNHHQEFQMMEGQLPFQVFFDNTDPAIVVQIDNGNALHGNGDFMAMMRRYPGRAKSVHLKPYSASGGYGPVIGEDDIDWGDFLRFCRDQGGTEHYIVEYEDEKTHPQLVGVELCIKGLRSLEEAGKI